MAEPSAPVALPAELVGGWRSIVGASDLGDRVMIDVAGRYAEPHRRYHGVDHLVHVVRRATVLAAAEITLQTGDAERTLQTGDAGAIVLAAWFHDAVYDPRAADNERRSADLAVRLLATLGASTEQQELVESLVMATREHRPTTVLEAVLIDADLAVLGAPPEAYDTYVKNVRAEYRHVRDEDWRIGRAQVLGHLLATPVFSTSAAAVHNVQARVNLTRELANLDG